MASNTIVPPAAAVRASDDEILGLTPSTTRRSGRAAASQKTGERTPEVSSQADVDEFFSALGSAGKESEPGSNFRGRATEDVEDGQQDSRADDDPENLNEVLDANPELRDAWHDAKAYREVFATPAEAQAATKLLGDLNRMDALFYSRRPEDHAELARAVSQLDPQAFASLARAMMELTSNSAAKTKAGEIPASIPVAPPQQNLRQADAAKTNEARAATSTANPGLTPAQADFFQATNASAVQSVMEAIETQVDRLLPEGISKSARNRVAGEIYRELDTTLQGNRALGQQMRDAFRAGSLDDAHRRSIVSLVTGRARQALPGVAKRVLNEWTNTIVSANQDRRTRQQTAERRVDISGSSGGNDARRAVSSRDIDYGRMSDGDILNL
jgi:hypothetical protein